MALVNLNFESQYLNGNTEVSIILPDKPRDQGPAQFYGNGHKYKVLWLLHGTFGDHTDWLRKSSIELYACEKDLIVVMPSALNSNYINWDHCMMGYAMGDYLTEELMPLVYNWFPASDKREDNFISGLSMGGGGTLMYALAYPQRFAAAAVLSAAARNYERLLAAPGGIQEERTLNGIANAGGVEEFLASRANSWRTVGDMVKAGADLPRDSILRVAPMISCTTCSPSSAPMPRRSAWKPSSKRSRATHTSGVSGISPSSTPSISLAWAATFPVIRSDRPAQRARPPTPLAPIVRLARVAANGAQESPRPMRRGGRMEDHGTD